LIPVIGVLKQKGTIPQLDELIELTPGGLFEMMQLKGLGGKKLSVLWKTAGIDSIESLMEACKKGAIASLKGFGEKTAENIIKAIEDYNNSTGLFHYAAVADQANKLVAELQQLFKSTMVALAGEIRRKCTTVHLIEIITAVDLKKWQQKKVRKLLMITSAKKEIYKAHTLDEIPVSIYKTTEKNFQHDLFLHTGTREHVNKVLMKIDRMRKFSTEKDIYKAAGIPFIVPEMRENMAEWKYKKRVEDLITINDIKGVVHNHTTWSDGIDKLEHFVAACKKLNYEYTVISDHSKNAHYAGGLKEDKVIKQMELIDLLNKSLKPFKIFKSIECDILVTGELDYNKDLLKKFDLVIVSVHQQLKMDKEKATRRLIKAIENPYTTILGHMTGRQLLIRPGYPLDFKKIIDACAANGVIIELNANPYRLDMDWSHIPYALSKNVMISINPDAHSIGEIDNIRWGVDAARKGGLTKDMTWNALSLAEIKKWLATYKNRCP
jgi:DNA polymerase (family 10)